MTPTKCARPTCNRTPNTGGRGYCDVHAYALGIIRPYVPHDQAMTLINTRKEAGYTTRALAHAAGISYSGLTRLIRNKTRMQRGSYDRLAATPPVPEVRTVPSWPLTRRLRALQAIGITQTRIAEDTGLTRSGITHISAGTYPTATVETDRIIRDYYQRMETTPAGGPTRGAEGRRWKVPFEWDDIDDPTEASISRSGQALSRDYVLITPTHQEAAALLVRRHGVEGARRLVGTTAGTLRNIRWRKTTSAPAGLLKRLVEVAA